MGWTAKTVYLFNCIFVKKEGCFKVQPKCIWCKFFPYNVKLQKSHGLVPVELRYIPLHTTTMIIDNICFRI